MTAAMSDPRRKAEAGYNLVILLVAISVLNILVAVSLPAWSHVIRREREEELISRGFQYAEAIRVFHNRFQRYPVKLEELVETKPRSIRHLWKDPMTDDGAWGIIFQGAGQPVPGQPDPNGRPGGQGGRGGQAGQVPDEGSDPQGDPSNGEEMPQQGGIGGPKQGSPGIGPIIGVYSKSPDESILVFYGHNRYDEWRFTEDLLTGRAGSTVGGDPSLPPPRPGPGGQPGAAGGLALSTRWLGRPLPSFLNQDLLQKKGEGDDNGLPNGGGIGSGNNSGNGRRNGGGGNGANGRGGGVRPGSKLPNE
jgi:type II secretory pathway pseudopilin PulG